MLNTPILFLIFNRPDTTAKVFAAIRKAKPKQLFIAADGPRINRPEEKAKVDAVKEIVSHIDWECEVYTLYRPYNLGCGEAVSSAINWFFSQVEQGIILEDDTLPNQSFFTFCEIMLGKYKNDDRVGQINGSNFQMGKKWGKATYYFSHYPMIWGWATWRRAWQHYDYTLDSFPQQASSSSFWKVFNSDQERAYWHQIFGTMQFGFVSGVNAIDTWDYQWIYTCLKNKWLIITPNFNLVTNIGFGASATHTKNESIVADLPSFELNTISHPHQIMVYKGADKRLFKVYFDPPAKLINQIRSIVYKALPANFISKLRVLRRTYFPNLK